MQNSRDNKLRERTADFFDSVPVGYCEFDQHGNIREINLAAAEMLGTEKGALSDTRFARYIYEEDRENFFLHLGRAFEIKSRQTCDICLLRNDGMPFYVQLNSMADDARCRTAITDITERRRSDEEIRRNEEQYRTIYNQTPVMLHSINREGVLVSVSDFWLEKMGYSREEVLGRKSTDFLTEESRRFATEVILPEFFERGFLKDAPYRMVRKDGEIMDVLLSAISEKDDTGHVLRSLAVIVDITDLKRAQAALLESEAKYRTMFETAREGIWQIDAQAKTILVNRRMADMLGYTVEEMLGRSLFEFMDEVWEQKARKNFENRLKGISEQHDFCFRRKDGTELWTILSAMPIMSEDGQFLYAFGMLTDITERKKAEEFIRHNGEQYLRLLETMNEGFVIVNKNMTIVYVNEAFCRIMGYKKEELVGEIISNLFDDRNRSIVTEQFMKRKMGESVPYDIEFICKDGSNVFATVSPKPVFDSEGAFQGSFAVITDVTSRRKTEAEIEIERNHLKKQVETTTAQLNDLYRQLEEYNHALKVLLKNSQENCKEIEENIVSNVREMIAPFLEKLKSTRLNSNQKNFLDMIETNLSNIVSPFAARLKSEMRNFTPAEIHVANLIREGKTIKDIADMLTISENTVMFHRTNIRKKLGLKHEKINLRTFLLSLDQ